MSDIFFRKLCVAALFSATVSLAQTPAAPALVFEVASIKPSGPLDPVAIQSGKMRIGMKVDGAICDIGAFSLKDLIRTAYEVKDFQISGPDWLGSAMNAQRFNIQATMPEGATEKQVPQMLQALLAERFKLVIHRETKDHAVYALIVGKGGPKLKESEPDPAAPEVPEEPKKGETVMGQGSSQVRISGSMEGGKGITIKGGPQGQMHMTMADGKMHMEAAKMTMSAFADMLTPFVDRPVVDMTELKGNYQVALDLSMDDLKNVARAAGMGMAASGGDGGKALTDASDPSGSSIFVSVQQLGLKLDARKAPLLLIVIDHLEKAPTEN
ncbi:MAG: TIGR03435 family protein [Bryobacteraceae bacterium]|jgi:uncharacterized protein (TIGR03435 family)